MPRRWECRSSQPRAFFCWFISWKAWKKLNGEQISGENRGRVSQEERLSAPAGWWDDIFHTRLSALTVNTQLTLLLLLFLCVYNLLQWPETNLWFSTATIWAPPKYFFFPLPLRKTVHAPFGSVGCAPGSLIHGIHEIHGMLPACCLPVSLPASSSLPFDWLIGVAA